MSARCSSVCTTKRPGAWLSWWWRHLSPQRPFHLRCFSAPASWRVAPNPCWPLPGTLEPVITPRQWPQRPVHPIRTRSTDKRAKSKHSWGGGGAFD
eukprot:1191883-Prorocentrum_minimum.AAC.1